MLSYKQKNITKNQQIRLIYMKFVSEWSHSEPFIISQTVLLNFKIANPSIPGDGLASKSTFLNNILIGYIRNIIGENVLNMKKLEEHIYDITVLMNIFVL